MVTDAGALGLALVAASLAARPPSRGVHVRPGPRGGPERADQRRRAAGPGRRARGQRDRPPRPTRPTSRAGSSSSSACCGAAGEHRRRVGAVARRAAQPEHRGRPAHVLADLFGSIASVDRRRDHPHRGLSAGGPDRRPVRRRAHAALGLAAAARLRAGAARGRAGGHRPRAGRPRRSPRRPGSSRSTTCTSGRSRPASRRWRRTSSSRRTRTATAAGGSCRRCCATASRSSTSRSRSITRPTAIGSCRSSGSALRED